MVLNCNDKLADIDGMLLIISWLVMKSLALAKLVHYFICLPTPPKFFMLELNKKVYRFLWKGKGE